MDSRYLPSVILAVLSLAAALSTPALGQESAGQSASRRISKFKQDSQGLGLTGVSDLDEPTLSRQGNRIQFVMPALPEAQIRLRNQGQFRQSGTHYTYDDTVAATPTPDTDSYGSSPGHNASANDYAIPGRSDWVTSTNHHSLGDGWFGTDLRYSVGGSRNGAFEAYAGSSITLMGFRTELLGGRVTSVVDTNQTAMVDDDRLIVTADARIVGQTTMIIEEQSVPLGQRFQHPGLSSLQVRLLEKQWDYMVGPVPVLITGWLQGNIRAGIVEGVFGTAGNSMGVVSSSAEVKSTGSLTAGVTAEPLGRIPAALRGVKVHGNAAVRILSGSVVARVKTKSSAPGPCFYAGLQDFRSLDGEAWVEAEYDQLRQYQVLETVGAICSVSWLQTICGPIQQYLRTASGWFAYTDRERFFSTEGRSWPNVHWVDNRSCEGALPPTTINLCNENSEAIFAAMMYYDATTPSWKSHGWYRLEANSCKSVSLGQLEARNVYVYAEWGGGKVQWSGQDGSLCIQRNSKFSFNNADQANQCRGEGTAMVRGKKIVIQPHAATTHTFGRTDLAAATEAHADVCNQSQDKVFYSYAYSNAGNWTARGWFSLAPSACGRITLKNYNGPVFVHAMSENRMFKWGRGYTFCTDLGNSFQLARADAVECDQGAQRKAQYSMIQIRRGQTTRHDLTTRNMLYARRACNDSDRAVHVAISYVIQHDDGRTQEGSQGWWELQPGQCSEMFWAREFEAIGMHATSSYGQWPGSAGSDGVTLGCVKSDGAAFWADTPINNCPVGHEPRLFRPVPGTAHISW